MTFFKTTFNSKYIVHIFNNGAVNIAIHDPRIDDNNTNGSKFLYRKIFGKKKKEKKKEKKREAHSYSKKFLK